MNNIPYGYNIDVGYLGKVDNKMMLFATEEEYIEYLRDNEYSSNNSDT